jgi:hypothetical protein
MPPRPFPSPTQIWPIPQPPLPNGGRPFLVVHVSRTTCGRERPNSPGYGIAKVAVTPNSLP